jgi:hypothetical protein
MYVSDTFCCFCFFVLSVLLFTSSNYPFGIFKLLVIVLSVLLFTSSDYPFGIFKLLVIVLSVLLFTSSDYPFGIFKLLVIVLSVLLFTASDYPFGIFKLFFSCGCSAIFLTCKQLPIHIENIDQVPEKQVFLHRIHRRKL